MHTCKVSYQDRIRTDFVHKEYQFVFARKEDGLNNSAGLQIRMTYNILSHLYSNILVL